ncbi:DNA polymerase delta, subunit 4-domain-containing protein [Glomus cerebriforme]|uniref:DNA polymerase delta, subunit 4-domain-containing protein n=1 Tax=Glomus cerebriforme TaxID=658196 RepID=A0A397TNQ6_9GLOM|nr:DNA polymerase delta, subunit 4-domain-containing protein [Glomus cerebriforme]
MSKKLVQQKLSVIFTSTKRGKAEKDELKKKLKQTIETIESEEQSIIVVKEESPKSSTLTFVRQKGHASDRQKISDESESENEIFDQDEDNDVSRETSLPNVNSEPEELSRDRVNIRSKLTFHEEDYTPMDKLLHSFDLNYKFGSNVGLTRLARWERAHRLGLNPPEEVKNVLTSEAIRQNLKLNESVFYGKV